MKVQRAYEDVLSIILDEPNLQLKKVQVEQVILNNAVIQGKVGHFFAAFSKSIHGQIFLKDIFLCDKNDHCGCEYP